MKPENFVKDLSDCYLTVEKIATSPDWQKLINTGTVDPGATTHLNDVLHYLTEAIACLEKANQQ